MADLALKDYGQARDLCSVFGKLANELIAVVENVAVEDLVLINRVGAAQFSGLLNEADPQEVMMKSLYSSNDPVEALQC